MPVKEFLWSRRNFMMRITSRRCLPAIASWDFIQAVKPSVSVRSHLLSSRLMIH